MLQKRPQKLQMAIFSPHSQFRLSCLSLVWLCLFTIGGASQSNPLMLSSSHSDYEDGMPYTSQITPHYEWHSASISETLNLPQETTKDYFKSSSHKVSFSSEEVKSFSEALEVTLPPNHQATTSLFTHVTRISNEILPTVFLFPTSVSPNLYTYSETSKFSTSSLPLIVSTRTPEGYSHIAEPVSEINVQTTISTSYQKTSISNVSTFTNSLHTDYISSMPASSAEQSTLPSNLTENPPSPSSSTHLSTESEETIEDIRDLLTTQLFAKKSNSKYNNMRYFLVLKAETCPPLGESGIDRELLKALSSLGTIKVTADISKIRCQTILNVNITAAAQPSFISKLDDISNQNLTLTVRNKTFQIIDIQQQLYFNKTDARLTSNVINLVAQSIFKAYVAVGSCFGLVLLVCIVAYCYKCWANTSRKRMGLRNNHTALSPEDYTLTPIPRPTTLYVDYYRNSLTADLYSTTSAGSAGSTSPIVETGVVQSFDTSIVPLEDSEPHFQNPKVHRNSAQCGSAKEDDVQKIQVVTMDGLIYCNSGTNSTEKLTSNLSPCQQKVSGVCNPTYQRY